MSNDNGTISDQKFARLSLDWIRDLNQQDIKRVMLSQTNNDNDLSMRMIFREAGGIETCILLWRELSTLTLHISERPLNELRRIYIRQHYKAEDPERCTKSLAYLLNVSEQFVREALTEDQKEDPRQGKLL